MLDLKDTLLILHPALAVVLIFPLIGIVVNRAWQVRQRRLELKQTGKSKIPPVSGQEHVQLGRWLSGGVVGIALLGLGFAIFSKIEQKHAWVKEPFRVSLVTAIFIATIASLILLYQAKARTWRAAFATLTGMGLIILGEQPEVFRRVSQWYLSHYYYGIAAALLMVFSLATVAEIYQDKQQRWRTVHIILNSVAVLLFIGQGFTGARDLLEIPVGWQSAYIAKCNFKAQTCPVVNP